MTAVIVTGGIDVSVGSSVAVGHGRGSEGHPRQRPAVLPPCCSVSRSDSVLGVLNGVLVAYGGIHPIIVTFGTLNLFRFLALRLFENKQVTGVPDTFAVLGGGKRRRDARRAQRLGARDGAGGTRLVLHALLGHRQALVRARATTRGLRVSPVSRSSGARSPPTRSPGCSSG
jgi:ABC-type xylose transport system permease subunit